MGRTRSKGRRDSVAAAGADGDGRNLLRELPSISRLLVVDAVRELSATYGEGLVKLQLRRLVEQWRAEVLAGSRRKIPGDDAVLEVLRDRLARFHSEGRRAINATGILLHTGLGRSVLVHDAAAALAHHDRYAVVQVSLDTGGRSKRDEKVSEMLMELTGAEATAIVNNNAAATMIALNTVAEGKEVLVSRGQLVEIGGSFRMPDVMAASGCILREVGTTNRTHPADYERAIGPNTAAICHVHTSNYRIRGFSGMPDIAELVEIGKAHNIPVIDDLGSGALVPLSRYGIAAEPLIADSLKAGADLVTCSGDKLIGGPQSGLVLGRQQWIAKLRKNPYARMFRVCKFTYAAMEHTLAHYLNETFEQEIPFYRQLSTSMPKLYERAGRVKQALSSLTGYTCEVREEVAYVGSGSIPDEGLKSYAVRVRPQAEAGRAARLEELAYALRHAVPSVFARIADDSLLLDMRSLLSEEEADELAELVLATAAQVK